MVFDSLVQVKGRRIRGKKSWKEGRKQNDPVIYDEQVSFQVSVRFPQEIKHRWLRVTEGIQKNRTPVRKKYKSLPSFFITTELIHMCGGWSTFELDYCYWIFGNLFIWLVERLLSISRLFSQATLPASPLLDVPALLLDFCSFRHWLRFSKTLSKKKKLRWAREDPTCFESRGMWKKRWVYGHTVPVFNSSKAEICYWGV